MILIDENFPDSQRQLLKSWRLSFKQIGVEIGREGMKEDAIIPLLHQLKQPTFFTLDEDFFDPVLRHSSYASSIWTSASMNRPHSFGVSCATRS